MSDHELDKLLESLSDQMIEGLKNMADEVDTSPATFPARLHEALSRRQPIDPTRRVNYNGEDLEIRDLTSSLTRAYMGYGHFPTDIAQREHLTRPDGGAWLYTPDTCLVAEQLTGGVWINREHLVCPGCGLDFT